MPLKKCTADGKAGYQWGDAGKCYTGPDAKKKAIKQGVAIEGPKKFSQKALEQNIALSAEDIDAISSFMYDEGYSNTSIVATIAALSSGKTKKEWDKIDKKELKRDTKKEKKEHEKDAIKDDKEKLKRLKKDPPSDKKKRETKDLKKDERYDKRDASDRQRHERLDRDEDRQDKREMDSETLHERLKHHKDAIKNINISIDGGSTAALVGHSGAGKSTIINLLPRFFDPREGEIHIDGQNISAVTLSSLRKNISMVSQDIILFDDTVRANIAYAKLDASEKQIKEACDFAAASDFIEALAKSYETMIGENGIKLSGGQKQRISIARAVLKNSPIILLDEATSSLDSESEEKVQNAIINLTKNKTTLVIAHRLSTIIRADKIFVLNQGKITDIGTHSELLKNSMIYKNLYSKQLSA